MRTVRNAEFLFIVGLIFSSDFGLGCMFNVYFPKSSSRLGVENIFNVDLKIKFSFFTSNLDGL
jgi:hypothetical protein